MPDLPHLVGACIPIIKSIPGTAANEAVEAAERAEAAAELAEQRSFAVTEEGEKIIFTNNAEGGDD